MLNTVKNKGGRPVDTGIRPLCPRCSSNRILKTGFVITKFGKEQCWLCKDCYKRWVSGAILRKELGISYSRKTSQCNRCGNTISASSKTGLCSKCRNELKISSPHVESEEHKVLKEVAKEFLVELGYSNEQLVEEYRILDTNGNGKAVLIVDVVGIKDKHIVAIECGGSRPEKLLKLADKVSKIYILPYGNTEIYEWNKKIKVCDVCGHKIN